MENFSATFKKINPFGPPIGISKLSDDTVSTFLSLTDEILGDKNSKSHGPDLAGQINNEKTILIKKLIEYNLYDIINEIQLNYVNSALNLSERPMTTILRDAWIVSQQENEYNPAHWHDNCTLSSVLYLKIPEYIPRDIPGKEEQDGKIVFIGGTNPGSPARTFETPLWEARPSPGDMFVFPSRLLHVVYPFIGPGERRSVSFNGIHLWKDTADSMPEEIKKFI